MVLAILFMFFVFFFPHSKCDDRFQRLDMIHILHSRESPLFNESLSRFERLSHLIRMDEARHSSSSSSCALSPSSSWAKSPVQSGITLGLGQYLVKIAFGTPSQNMLLIADTGSDLVWLQCAQNIPRRTTDKFMSTRSSTFSPLPCTARQCSLVPAPPRDAICASPRPCSYVYDYADGSRTTGFLARDDAAVGDSAASSGVEIENVAFGCGTRNVGSSFAGAGGVLGMGQGDLSFTTQSARLFGNTFSYCLMDFLSGAAATDATAAAAPTAASFLYMGKRDFAKNPNPPAKNPNFANPAYTRLLANPLAPTFYYVRLESLRLAGRLIPIAGREWSIDAFGNGGTIVDSGSTLSYLRLPAFLALVSSIHGATRHLRRIPSVQGMDPCFNVSGMDEIQIEAAMPQLEIELLGGVILQPPVENYFVDVAFDVKCLAIRPTLSPFGFNVLGNLMQQGYHVEFDRANSRIGFAHTNCQDW